jgi:hypothetical protein
MICQIVYRQCIQCTLLKIIGVFISPPIKKCLFSDLRCVHRYHQVTHTRQLTHPQALVELLQLSPQIPLALQVSTIVNHWLILCVKTIVVF